MLKIAYHVLSLRQKLNNMNATPEQISALIRQRRAIFPKTYNDKPISQTLIEEILENANWAPTHRLTEPWRFKVFTGASLARLGQYLADWYKNNTPADSFSEKKYEKNLQNPQRSACVIAICMQRDPEERVPEWEEIAAVACAVQNMWLTCTAYDIGCYWSTPRAALEADEFLGLQSGERCLGLFYMGYHDLPELPGKRSPISEKVEWLSA
jgi:nitroreductase